MTTPGLSPRAYRRIAKLWLSAAKDAARLALRLRAARTQRGPGVFEPFGFTPGLLLLDARECLRTALEHHAKAGPS